MYRDPPYTIEPPAFKDIVGEYKLETSSQYRLWLPDSLAKKTTIRFNADSTFVLEYYPFHFWTQTIKDYTLINASGTWKIDRYYDHYWTIPMTFEQTGIIGTNYIERTKIQYFSSFRIINFQPPFKIYVKFHPFFVGGVILKKL